jgi:hypothetical protein
MEKLFGSLSELHYKLPCCLLIFPVTLLPAGKRKALFGNTISYNRKRAVRTTALFLSAWVVATEANHRDLF